jgi:predicted nucleic acid-binding protein
MSVRIFIDTNIFVYAHVSDDLEKHEIAADLLKKYVYGSKIIISTQVLGEFYSAMSKYKRAHAEIDMFLADIIRCANVRPISLSTVEMCLKLKEEYGYSYWDSLVLASALENDCEILYSEDMKHGHKIKSIVSIQNPFILFKL